MRATCPVCKQPADVYIRTAHHLACKTCASCAFFDSPFRPDPSEGRGVSGRNVSPATAGDGGEASAPLSLGLPANPSGDIPSSVKESGGAWHRVPGPFGDGAGNKTLPGNGRQVLSVATQPPPKPFDGDC